MKVWSKLISKREEIVEKEEQEKQKVAFERKKWKKLDQFQSQLKEKN